MFVVLLNVVVCLVCMVNSVGDSYSFMICTFVARVCYWRFCTCDCYRFYCCLFDFLVVWWFWFVYVVDCWFCLVCLVTCLGFAVRLMCLRCIICGYVVRELFVV